tara:strand:- start:294 stop:1754 length:1461 start_codon:yes stop_codon:yes gene_type:complete
MKIDNRKLFRLIILLVWCILFGRLLSRDYFIEKLEIRESQAIQRGLEESYMGIYFQKDRIGYVKNRMVGNETGGFILNQEATMHLNILDKTYPIKMNLFAELNDSSLLKNFRFNLFSPFYELNALGKVIGSKVHYSMNTGKDKTSNIIQLSEPPFISTHMKSYLLQNNLKEGEKYKIPYFDPITMSGQESIIQYKGFKKELIREKGRIYNLHHFTESIAGMKIDFYLDEQGNLIKETSPAGFVFYAEPEFHAKNIISKGTEILGAISVQAIGQINNLSEYSTINYRLTIPEDHDFNLNKDRQSFSNNILTVSKEIIPNEDAEVCFDDSILLKSTPYIQSDSKYIIKQAESIVSDADNDLQKVIALIDWVYLNIEKKPVLSIPDAVSTLRSRVGDCNEHAALFAALSRSVSIPARVAAGVTYHDGKFYYHAWNEVCIDGKWISLDTTNKQFPADLTHIKFVEGETVEQMKIGALLGRLKIEILGNNS